MKQKYLIISKDIFNQECIEYDIGDDFLVVTDKNEVIHYYRKDCIVAFHIKYLGEYAQ